MACMAAMSGCTSHATQLQSSQSAGATCCSSTRMAEVCAPGSRRMHAHCHAAGGLVRHILKSLEEIGIVEKDTTTKGGRRLSAAGRRDMDLIAGRVTVDLSLL